MRKRRKGGGNLPPGSHRNWWENGPGRKGHQAMARHGAGRWRTLGGLAGMTWMKDSWASISSQIHSLIPLLQAALPGGPPSIFHPPTHRSWVISPPSQASGCEAPSRSSLPSPPYDCKVLSWVTLLFLQLQECLTNLRRTRVRKPDPAMLLEQLSGGCRPLPSPALGWP